MLTILVMRFLLANASLSFSDDDVLVVGAVLVAVTAAAAALGAIALMSLASFFLPSFAVGAVVVVSSCFCTTASDDVTAVTSKAATAIEDATGTDWTSLLT